MTDGAAADYLYRALGQFRVPGPFLPVRSARPRGSHVYAVASPAGLISVGSSASALGPLTRFETGHRCK